VNSKSKGKTAQPTAVASSSGLKRNILLRARSAAVRQHLQRLLVELCHVDTTPKPDPAHMRTAEDQCFKILERELGSLPFADARLERRPVNPAIEQHANYSQLHFTKTASRPAGLSAPEAYAGRTNLLYLVPGAERNTRGCSVALNAHIDVVPPYFPPRVRQGIVYGRGSCDDKGPVVSMVVALQILAAVMADEGLEWNKNVVAMFVVEEETGGNGSLSLAMDRDLKKLYDSILVGECTGLTIHPANRGAVWYRAELKSLPGVPALELFAFVNEELEKEGAAIRAESRHALFPQRPVQTCHGIIGPFGEHPSRICGKVIFKVHFDSAPGEASEVLVRDCLESGLAAYVGLYGDKTKVADPATGKPVVSRHYDLRRAGNGFEVTVNGATGHMGAIRERDGAITKMAHLLRSLIFSKARLVASGGPVRFDLEGHPDGHGLVLEGGQGFVPTHGIDEVMERLRQAASRGAESYLRRCGQSSTGTEAVAVTYEKLHNVAFDGDPDSATMRNAIAAAKTCGLWKGGPVRGWTVSCDSRLFASEYPGLPVLTFGPGELAFAHSDQEQVALDDVVKAVELLALFLLRQTGTLI
jgi:acetylornithine deacetylase/succinyl-diaminopimelate desuccinylase-like protein